MQPYRALRERDAAARREGFIVEGALALERAARQRLYPLGSVLLAQGRELRLGETLDALAPEVAVYSASRAVLDRICGLPLHRGVLAWGPQPEPMTAEALLQTLPATATLVCLVGLNDVENMGAIFRNAAAFGAAAVLLDATCCDPLYRRAIRVSVGASLITPHARLSPGEDLRIRLAQAGFAAFALTPGGRTPLSKLRPEPRSALLFGAEGPGLPADVLAWAQTVRIPMAEGLDSLNVATATGVALHHLMAGREPAR